MKEQKKGFKAQLKETFAETILAEVEPISAEILDLVKENMKLGLVEVSGKLDCIKEAKHRRDVALKVVSQVEEVLKYLRNKPDEQYYQIHQEMKDLDTQINAAKRVFEGVLVTKVPFESPLRKDLDELRDKVKQLDAIAQNSVAEDNGTTWREAHAIWQEEENLWKARQAKQQEQEKKNQKQ